MTPEEDEEFERIAQKQLAALKKSTRATTEDAAVRAVHKVIDDFAQGAHTEEKVEYQSKMIQCPHCDGSVRVPTLIKHEPRGLIDIGRIFTPEKAEEPKPAAWMDSNDDVFFTEEDAHKTGIVPIRPLYTSHTQRWQTWAGLTDDELREIEKEFQAERVRTSDEEYLIIYPSAYWSWMRAIETKLKEKNT